jgi:hypothetical protein
MQELVRHTISFFYSRQSSDNQVDVTGVSTVSFTDRFSQTYGRYNGIVCQCNLSLGQRLSDVFHTNCKAFLDAFYIEP